MGNLNARRHAQANDEKRAIVERIYGIRLRAKERQAELALECQSIEVQSLKAMWSIGPEYCGLAGKTENTPHAKPTP